MENKQKVCLDFDSTLVDLVTPWLEWMHETGVVDELYQLEDVHSYCWFEQWPEAKNFFMVDPFFAYSRVKPFDYADKFVIWCQQNFEVEIVTHSSQPSTEAAKRAYIETHFPGVEVRFFSELQDKFKYIDPDSILIDDYPRHVLFHAARNQGKGIIINHDARNGWSHIMDYGDIFVQENVNPNLVSIACNFTDIKDILRKEFKN